jgi:hypothetical protein
MKHVGYADTERDEEMSADEDTPEEVVLPPPDGAEWPSTSPVEAPTPPGRMVTLHPATVLAAADDVGTPKEEMCCDGSGRTAAQHRAESPDHKCCVDT